ncbi:hypothetical protein [Xanthomonas albilineans]|uniref:hypothetical protein n=1 Tax=Xanthomonas albilineans TaxID=29447 RepID=UPI000698C21D|nr:hypothetical protein [Xanthomonas albilineans]
MTMRPLVLCLSLLSIGNGAHSGADGTSAPQAPVPVVVETYHHETYHQLTSLAGIGMFAAHWCGDCRCQQTARTRAQVRHANPGMEYEVGRRILAALGREGVPITEVVQHTVEDGAVAALSLRLSSLRYPRLVLLSPLIPSLSLS